MAKLAHSTMQEVNLLMWAAEPGHKPGHLGTLDASEYSAIFEELEGIRRELLRLGQEGVRNPIFQHEHHDTLTSCCLSLLRKRNHNDKETQVKIYTISRLAIVWPLAFVQARVRCDVVDALWTRMKNSSGGLSAFNFSGSGMSYFA